MFILNFVILFVCCSLCSGIEAAEITNRLSAVSLGPETLNLNKFNYEDGHNVYCNQKGDVIIPDTFDLTWSDDAVWEIQAAGNIIFSPNAKIVHTGNGGGLILRAYHTKLSCGYYKPPSAGTLIFTECSLPIIDFSASTNSAISIFYRPSKAPSGVHKYDNPTDFSSRIQFPIDAIARDSIYFQSFMLIENKTDFIDASRYEGSYALGQPIEISQSKETDRLTLQSNSILNMNDFDWAKKWSNNYDFDLFVLGEGFSRSLKCSPPYLDYDKKFLQAAQTGDMSTLAAEDLYIYDCRVIEGSTRRNLMHLAAASGHTHFLRKAYKNITERCGVIHQDLQRYFLSLVMTHDKWGNTALDLAALGEHFEAVNWLVGLFNDQSLVTSLTGKVETLSQAYTDGDIALDQKYERIISYLNRLYDVPVNFRKYWLGYPLARVGFEKEYDYARIVNQRFFMRTVGTTKTSKLLRSFQKAYASPAVSSLGLEFIPARSRIILFANIAEEKIRNKEETSRFRDRKDLFPTRYRLQQDPLITVSVRNDPTKDQLGNVYLIDLPSYDPNKPSNISTSIKEIVKHFSGDQGNQKVGLLMRQSRLTGMPITKENLLDQAYAADASQLQKDARFLNELSLLLNFEVSRKLHEQPVLPIGVICARAFTLIEKGHLTWEQFLSIGSPYHFFSGYKRVEAMHAISELFHQTTHERKEERAVDIESWNEKYAYGKIIASAEEMHQESLEQYGGGYESDGDDYTLT